VSQSKVQRRPFEWLEQHDLKFDGLTVFHKIRVRPRIDALCKHLAGAVHQNAGRVAGVGNGRRGRWCLRIAAAAPAARTQCE
jgi:hypothetical protein